MLTIEELEKILCAAMDAAIAKGFAIVWDCWGKDKQCCAIGSLLVQDGDCDVFPSIYGVLAYSYLFNLHEDPNPYKNFGDFISGFSGAKLREFDLSPNNKACYELGLKLREKYKPRALFCFNQ